MSRRKQSKPRQIKRSPGDLDGAEDNAVDSLSLSGEEGGVSDPEDSADGDASSRPPSTPLYEGLQDCQRGPDGEEGGDPGSDSSCQEEQEELVKEEEMFQWKVPDELDVREGGGARRVVADSDLHPDTTWGPYPGAIQSEAGAAEEESEDPKVRVVCEDPDCWLGLLPLTCDASASNCSVSSRGGALFCKVSRALSPGEVLLASVMPPPGSSCSPPSVKEEPLYPAALHSDIQLLPQQAGMAAILATAVVNKDIFPCKDCGIWYRSERNLQAHLMYYCASRQKAPSAASSPPQDKPKESYPNERVCPFPQCNKSCPSASSLEIHMRTHSGERPFVCLICLSAFTTKANCERHLKVHTDTLNGVCHGCGFVSTTRDILYSHLVTSHMVCQPGSHSEVYSPGPGPGPGLPKVPVSTGLGPGDSGVVLKCQVCGHNSDSPSQLQQHVRTHLEVRVPAERSPTPRQSTPSDHTLLRLEERQVAVVPKPESSSPGANGSSATPRGCSPAEGRAPPLQIKEEPRSDNEGEEQRTEANGEKEEQEEEQEEEQDSGGEAEPAARSAKGGRLGAPTSPVPSAVKAEPTSPTPGSSPAHAGGAGPVVPGGALFLPQYMFNPEAAILPQASEILAKMSEMVHSRLKQGQSVPQNSPAPNAFFPPGAAAPTAAATATPPHAGATCFECDITFNNINNFYAHKRLYCSSRHHGEGAAPPPGAQLAAASSSTRGAAASPGAAGSRAASASPSDSEPPAGGAESQRPVDVKLETPTGRDGISSSSEGEGGGGSVGGGGRTSDGSQSPAGAGADESEDDPNRTFCQACNIRFSRHDNYTVHKRFYCASRHDPSNQRSLHVPKAPAAAFLPQPIRTRKRKKMYEIHMARTEALANAAAAAAAAAATASAPSPSVLGLTLKREASPSGGRGSSPEGDGPMDLSKRPRLREAPPPGGAGAGVLPVLPLSDYHKCTACSISFNSIENYLAHKTYYCPATTLQPHTLEQLARIKRSASRSPKARPPDLPPGEAKALPAERAHEQGASSSPLASAKAASPSPRTPPSAGSPQVICPYCPTRLISCDLMEHFRTAHGLVVSVQPPQEPLALPESPCRSPRDGPSSGATGGTNGQVGSAPPSPASPPVNGDASPSSSPRGAPSRTLSPVPENLSHLPPQAAAPTPQPAPPPATKGAAPPPVPNGGSRFCRLCNIKFSSLSTFIAHKKYYCSSHSAEHVK